MLLSSPGAFKTYAKGREEPGDSHPIISEWGGAWEVTRPGEGGPSLPVPGVGNLRTHTLLSHVFSMSPVLCLALACLNMRGNVKMRDPRSLRGHVSSKKHEASTGSASSGPGPGVRLKQPSTCPYGVPNSP
jgi:hypothetical protein